MLGEEENYKYLGLLEADTIKQVEMKEKFKKSITWERENYSKPKYIAEILSKKKHLGYSPNAWVKIFQKLNNTLMSNLKYIWI